MRSEIIGCGVFAFTPTLAPRSLLHSAMPDFRKDVLTLVKEIPKGKVMTYGQVAMLIGSPQKPRQVGMVLRGLRDLDGDVPWQRVVNAQGGISTYKVGTGELQKALLESEGIKVRRDKTVDLKAYQWWPEREEKG
jgi:methylated-DNA-protein-cysteine methyltransferase related protein